MIVYEVFAEKLPPCNKKVGKEVISSYIYTLFYPYLDSKFTTNHSVETNKGMHAQMVETQRKQPSHR